MLRLGILVAVGIVLLLAAQWLVTYRPELPRIADSQSAATGDREIEINPRKLDEYVGTFRLDMGIAFEFLREGNALMVEQVGAPKLRIYPESTDRFFYKNIEAAFTFARNEGGTVDRIILHQFGKDMPGQKVSFEGRVIELDPETLNDYAGTFRLDGTGLTFVFSREGNRLMV